MARGEKVEVREVKFPEIERFLTVKTKKYELDFRDGEDEEGKGIYRQVPLQGQKFLFLDHYYRIYGEHRDRRVQVKSTWCKHLKEHPFTVKTRTGQTAQVIKELVGLYGDIRSEVLDQGLVLGREIFALSERGVLVSLKFNRWSSAIKWGKFYWEHVNEVNGVEGNYLFEFVEPAQEEGKKGKYNVPQFQLVPLRDQALAEKADRIFEEQVKPFNEAYFAGLGAEGSLQEEEGVKDESAELSTPIDDMEEDLPF